MELIARIIEMLVFCCAKTRPDQTNKFVQIAVTLFHKAVRATGNDADDDN